MVRALDDPGIGVRIGLVRRQLLGNFVRGLVILGSVNEQDRKGIVLGLHLVIRNLIQSRTVQNREEQLHDLEGRMPGEIDILPDIMVERIGLQQEGAVQNHGVDVLG
ncbi:hypothetical protein D3C73_1246050 [compost metagenome]